MRLSEFEHAQLEKAREELMNKGIANLPEIQPLCSQCGNQLEGFKVSYEYVRCSHCGYEENSAALTGIGTFALGAIAALGAGVMYFFFASAGLY